MYVVGRILVFVLVTVDPAFTNIEDVVVKLTNSVVVLKITAFSTRVSVAKMVVGIRSVTVKFCWNVETSSTVVGACKVLRYGQSSCGLSMVRLANRDCLGFNMTVHR